MLCKAKATSGKVEARQGACHLSSTSSHGKVVVLASQKGWHRGWSEDLEWTNQNIQKARTITQRITQANQNKGKKRQGYLWRAWGYLWAKAQAWDTCGLKHSDAIFVGIEKEETDSQA